MADDVVVGGVVGGVVDGVVASVVVGGVDVVDGDDDDVDDGGCEVTEGVGQLDWRSL